MDLVAKVINIHGNEVPAATAAVQAIFDAMPHRLMPIRDRAEAAMREKRHDDPDFKIWMEAMKPVYAAAHHVTGDQHCIVETRKRRGRPRLDPDDPEAARKRAAKAYREKRVKAEGAERKVFVPDGVWERAKKIQEHMGAAYISDAVIAAIDTEYARVFGPVANPEET